jgi:hypothetical protein
MDSMRLVKLKSTVIGLATALCVVASSHVAMAAEDKAGNKAKAVPEVKTPVTEFSDAQLKAFAVASTTILEVRQKYWPQVQAAGSEDEMRKIASIAQKEMMQALSTSGLTVEQYNEVVAAAQKDPSLVERIKQIEKPTKKNK